METPTLELLREVMADPEKAETAVNALALMAFIPDCFSYTRLGEIYKPAGEALTASSPFWNWGEYPESDKEVNETAAVLRKVDNENRFGPPIRAYFDCARAYLQGICRGVVREYSRINTVTRYHDIMNLVNWLDITSWYDKPAFGESTLTTLLYTAPLWAGGKIPVIGNDQQEREITYEDLQAVFTDPFWEGSRNRPHLSLYTKYIGVAYTFDAEGNRVIRTKRRHEELAHISFDSFGRAVCLVDL